MKREELKNPFVIVASILSILLIIAILKIYFFDSILKSFEKIEVLEFEKQELKLLTESYLIQNKYLKLNKIFSTPTSDNRFAVAAEYYYLKNDKDVLSDYEAILEIAKEIFDEEYIDFSNFEINVDEEKCGKEKYSTINGFSYNDQCDTTEMVYEIKDIYKSNEEYVVEFYATTAVQTPISSTKKCDNFKKALSYNLTLTNLLDKEFYNEDYARCCEDDCELEGIYSLQKDILNQLKNQNIIYKMIFSKNESNFVYKEIKK